MEIIPLYLNRFFVIIHVLKARRGQQKSHSNIGGEKEGSEPYREGGVSNTTMKRQLLVI